MLSDFGFRKREEGEPRREKGASKKSHNTDTTSGCVQGITSPHSAHSSELFAAITIIRKAAERRRWMISSKFRR
jgi:hypothetical protein